MTEHGGFRTGKGCVNQNVTLNQCSEKAREKEHWGFLGGFMNLENVLNKVSKEAFWKILRIYNVDRTVK